MFKFLTCTIWRRLIYNVLQTSVKPRLCSNVVATSIQRRKKRFFLSYSENCKRCCLGKYLGMKFCKLIRFFNHTLQNQKRRNSQVYVASSHRRCSVKKVFLKISQISHENTCVGVFFCWSCRPFQECKFIKIKRDSNTGFFVKFVKLLRTLILKNICERLLLIFYFGKSHTG